MPRTLFIVFLICASTALAGAAGARQPPRTRAWIVPGPAPGSNRTGVVAHLDLAREEPDEYPLVEMEHRGIVTVVSAPNVLAHNYAHIEFDGNRWAMHPKHGGPVTWFDQLRVGPREGLSGKLAQVREAVPQELPATAPAPAASPVLSAGERARRAAYRSWLLRNVPMELLGSR